MEYSSLRFTDIMELDWSKIIALVVEYRPYLVAFLLLILAAYALFVWLRARPRSSEIESPDRFRESSVRDAMSPYTQLDPIAFEKLVGEIMKLEGYNVTEMGEQSYDGGIDLIAENSITHAPAGVQCKKYHRELITLKEMREFFGALCAGGYEKGIFVTLKGFTRDAKEFALDHNIDTWDAVRPATKVSASFSTESNALSERSESKGFHWYVSIFPNRFDSLAKASSPMASHPSAIIAKRGMYCCS